MAKAAVAVVASVLGTESSAGLPPVFGQSVPVAVTFTPHKNPDGTAVKDTRT